MTRKSQAGTGVDVAQRRTALKRSHAEHRAALLRDQPARLTDWLRKTKHCNQSGDSPRKAMSTFKQQAHDLVDQLPESAGWRDLIYRAAVRCDIEQGLQDSDAGRIASVEEVSREFGIADKPRAR